MTGLGEQIMFWILGPICVLAALGLLFAKKAVHAALGVALVMINLGIFYIAQEADFLGIIQIFVYTGAVMMLFLFVLMLVGVDSADSVPVAAGAAKEAAVVAAEAGLGPTAFATSWAISRATDTANFTGAVTMVPTPSRMAVAILPISPVRSARTTL